ncbi:TRAP transporter permease [Sporosarcina sp. FA9]|uniref:TRAP transporter permease n=1 Tax=Sporosarcina sp. FA9 TaxID=3413030 RepID=UPI003F65909B
MSTLNQEELLEKYDKESTYRKNLGGWGWVTLSIGVLLTLFHMYTGYRGSYPSFIQGAIHVGTGLSLAFLYYPLKPSMSRKKGVVWYDAILSLLGMSVYYYIVVEYERIITHAIIFGFTTLDMIVATLGIILLLEATRRVVGLPIVIIALAAIGYYLWGNLVPLFGTSGANWKTVSTELFFSSEAIFGVPTQVSSTYIYLFLFFSVMLVQTNIGAFFNDLAFRMTGRFTGGSAKTAVIASGLQGMVNGSTIANTVGSGSFTIPMMKRSGFHPTFAGAVEASASTGGQIMPPIMGAAAFIMASYVGIPYNQVIMYALIPAILYFVGVFMGTHFEAKKMGILGIPKEELPKVGNLIKRLDLLIPIVFLIGILLMGYTPTFAALLAILVTYLVSLSRKDTRLSFTKLIQSLEIGARTALPVICACATAGIVVGTVTKTGLGLKLAGSIIGLAGGVFILVLFFTMIACLLLGMGLPTTANYVVTAIMAAPALIQFGVPVISAHMFVFYFGIVADITPPVCLAAYAASGIAGSNPMKTGINAVKLSVAAFIVPYMFIFNPILLLQDATVIGLLIAIPTAIIGIVGLSASVMGYFVKRTLWFERILLFGFGLLLIEASVLYSLIGLAGLVAVGMFQHYRKGLIDEQQTTTV